MGDDTMTAKFMLLAGASGLFAAAPALAQDAPPPATAATIDRAAPEQPTEGEDVVVLGFGQSRQVQTVTSADLERLTPGTSPLKASTSSRPTPSARMNGRHASRCAASTRTSSASRWTACRSAT
jgi:hypothetical protein